MRYVIAAIVALLLGATAVYAHVGDDGGAHHAHPEPVVIADNEIDYMIAYMLSDEWGTPSELVSPDTDDEQFDCVVAVGRNAQELVGAFGSDSPDEVSVVQGEDRWETSETALHWMHKDRPGC